jgi:hypothetical protein
MANVEAFESGFDSGQKAQAKRKQKSAAKKTGGKKNNAAWNQGKEVAEPGTYKKGGKVRKTGSAKVHKGEVILTAAQAKACGGKMGKSKSRGRKRVSGKSS